MGRAPVLLFALCLACGPRGPHGARDDRRPDVVVVVVDTLRPDRLPTYGYDGDTAPFLSRLAERSVVFERAWATSSWTAPSTASIFTSVHPNQHGVTEGLNAYKRQRRQGEALRINRIPADLETLPRFFKRLGYRTFGITDNPTVGGEIGFDEGFDHFETFDYFGAKVVSMAVRLLAPELAEPEPFFLYLHFMDPHAPYHPHEPWFRGDAWSNTPENRSAAYDSEIRYLDGYLESIFEAAGVDEETVVVFTADHGEEFGDHGGYLHGFQLYSELVSVPLWIQHPGVEPVRRRISADVSILDILPTLRDVLGVPPSPQDEGRSLVPYYTDDSPPSDERTLFAMRSHEGGGEEWGKAAVIRGRYKYILSRRSGEEELYDLREDPSETRNRLAELPEVSAEMRSLWESFHAEARRWKGETVDVELDPAQVKRLQDLGYGGKGEEEPDR